MANAAAPPTNAAACPTKAFGTANGRARPTSNTHSTPIAVGPCPTPIPPTNSHTPTVDFQLINVNGSLNIIPPSKPSKNQLLEQSKQRSLQRTLDQPTHFKPKPSLSKPKSSLWPAPIMNWADDPHDEEDSHNNVDFWHDRKHHSYVQERNDTRFSVNAPKETRLYCVRRYRQTERAKEINRHYKRGYRKTEKGKEVAKHALRKHHQSKKGKETLGRSTKKYRASELGHAFLARMNKKQKEVRVEGLGKHSVAAFQNASAADIGKQTSENPKCKSNLISILLVVWPFSTLI